MPPAPPWRLAPFRAPAAFDVNLCTDSVPPEDSSPVRLRYAWVLWPLLSRIPCKFQLLEYRMGPFPALRSQRNSSFLTGLNVFIAGFALPSRASSRVSGLGNSRPKAPAITAEDPFSPPFSGGSPGIWQKLCSANLTCHQGLARTLRSFRGSGASVHFTRHPNSQTGACGRSSQCPAPGT